MDEIDRRLAVALINERRHLRRQLAGLTNAAIADKLDLPRDAVAGVSREMRRRIQATLKAYPS
jgi:hypothetical protein